MNRGTGHVTSPNVTNLSENIKVQRKYEKGTRTGYKGSTGPYLRLGIRSTRRVHHGTTKVQLVSTGYTLGGLAHFRIRSGYDLPTGYT